MNHFEEDSIDNDFELEFSDLPPDEKSTFTGRLVTQAFHFFNRFDNIAKSWRTWGPLLLSMLRTWLFTDGGGNRSTIITERSETGEFVLEITDLPSLEGQRFSATLATLRARLRPRMRLWRVVLIICTLLLVLLLILGNLPNLRESFSSFLVQSAPIPPPDATNSGTTSSWSSIQIVIVGSPGVINVGHKPSTTGDRTVIIVGGSVLGSDATLGLAPQGQDCPGRPAIGLAHEIGTPPVLATGFSGPSATLHLYPMPVSVPAYPALFGWTASILIEVPTNFSKPVQLDDGELNDGPPMLLQVDSTQEPSATLTLDPMQLMPTPSNDSKGQSMAWSLTLFFPAAGCYALDASWAGGHWQGNFSAGM